MEDYRKGNELKYDLFDKLIEVRKKQNPNYSAVYQEEEELIDEMVTMLKEKYIK